MPFIIAATNFSELGETAVDYACQLAVEQHAELVVLHSYVIPVMFSDIPLPTPVISDAKNDADSQMAELVNDCRISYPTLMVTGKVIYGDITEALDEYTEQERQPWLVVVGNSSAGEEASWTDGLLKNSFKKLKYPVLSVPPGITYSKVQRLCFAFDNKHTGNDVAFKQLVNLSIRLKAELHVLNVQTDVHNQDNNPDIDAGAREMLSHASPRYHIVFDQDNTETAIIKFIEENEIDWLIVIPRSHSFFEGLFHKSLTRAIAHHTKLPIAALHDHHA